jgi:hypothetical protein
MALGASKLLTGHTTRIESVARNIESARTKPHVGISAENRIAPQLVVPSDPNDFFYAKIMPAMGTANPRDL